MAKAPPRKALPRPVTSDMLAPHLVGQALLLHMPDRPGLIKLLAADADGGIVYPYSGAEPLTKGSICSFRLVDETFGPVRMVARALDKVNFPAGSGPYFAVEWIAITTTGRYAYMNNILGALGVKAHIAEGRDIIPMGRELLFDPELQQVRLIEVNRKHGREPTVELAAGTQNLAHTQPHILVETRSLTPSPRWGSTPKEFSPYSVEAKRHVRTPIANLLGRPLAATPAQVSTSPESTYRVTSHEQTPVRTDRVSAPTAKDKKDRPVAPRRSPDTVPGLPEFSRRPSPGELVISKFPVTMLCVSVGQRSLSITLNHGRSLAIGQSMQIGVPAEPTDRGLIWVEGAVERVEPREDGGTFVSFRLGGVIPREYRRLVQFWSLQR